MANVLNMKELVGTSYYFLQKYFGKDVQTTSYNDFIPQSLKEKLSLERQSTGAGADETVIEEIMGVQAVGSTVLENKDGEEIAQLTLTELPTLYSSMTTSSVGLQFVPGKIAQEKVTKVEEAKPKQKDIIAEQVGPSGEQDQKVIEEELDEEEYVDNTINQPVAETTTIQVAREQQVIKEQFETAVKEAADYKVIEEQEKQSELEQLKQWVDKATVDKTKAEINLKEAEDDFKANKNFLGFGNKTLEDKVKEKQTEKEKAETDYKTISEKYLEALKIEREQKKKQTIPTVDVIPEGDESEEEKDDSSRQNISNVATDTMNTILLSVGKNRAVLLDKTKAFLIQTKEKLEQFEQKQKSRPEFDVSALDSQVKIDSLRQENTTLKKEIDKIYEAIEKGTEEYAKLLKEKSQKKQKQ